MKLDSKYPDKVEHYIGLQNAGPHSEELKCTVSFLYYLDHLYTHETNESKREFLHLIAKSYMQALTEGNSYTIGGGARNILRYMVGIEDKDWLRRRIVNRQSHLFGSNDDTPLLVSIRASDDGDVSQVYTSFIVVPQNNDFLVFGFSQFNDSEMLLPALATFHLDRDVSKAVEVIKSPMSRGETSSEQAASFARIIWAILHYLDSNIDVPEGEYMKGDIINAVFSDPDWITKGFPAVLRCAPPDGVN